jgi:hypothetical protein
MSPIGMSVVIGVSVRLWYFVSNSLLSSLAEGEDVEYAAWSAPGVTEVDNKLVIEEEGYCD